MALDITGRSFTTVRRGLDPAEVRDHLDRVASELTAVRAREEALRDELAAARASAPVAAELDEATVSVLLGEEAARLLATAREGANAIRQRTEENVERLLRDGQADAARLREEVALEAARRRQEAEAEAEATLDAARQRGREMVAEAQAVRERMLADLGRRRAAVRAQIAHLVEARDRLAARYVEARGVADEILSSLDALAPDNDDDEVELPPPSTPLPPPSMTSTIELLSVEPAAAAASAEPVADEPPAAVPVAELVAVEASAAAVPVAELVALEASTATPAAELAAVEASATQEPPVAETAMTPAESAPKATDLFARLRAEPPVVATAAPTSPVVEAVEAVVEPSPPAHEAALVLGELPDELDPAVVALAQRDAALAPLGRDLARRFKRALSDEENDVLDLLRRSGTSAGADDIIGDPTAHAARFREAAQGPLWEAASTGAEQAAVITGQVAVLDDAAVLDELLSLVDLEVAAPLRGRLVDALDRAGSDVDTAVSSSRAAFREWRAQHLDVLAAHLVVTAHGRGQFAAIPAGTPIRWVVDPGSPGCPDADDNVLGGVVACGEAFPTGDLRTPAHLGCRCGIFGPRK